MRRSIVLLFVLVIALPLAANLAGVDGGDAEAENRELAPFPQWDGTLASAVAYPDGLSRWFEDHFAFRSSLVRWYGESRLRLLRVSPSSAVVKGTGGWFYYADDGGAEDYGNARVMTDGETSAWRASLVGARDWLAQRHTAFVFLVAPDKYVIYPEHMPTTIRRINPASRTDQLYGTLAGTAVSAVDVRPALLAAKRDDRLYFYTDTHWNDRGAFVAYQQIIEAVRRQVPATPPPWPRADFQATGVDTPGRDLAGMMGLRRVLHETDLQLIPKRPRRAHVVGSTDQPTAEVGRLVTEIADPTLPRAVIFRDSFVSHLVPFLSEHFSRAVYLWQNDFDANAVIAEHPDVVIQEIVGRHLYGFVASPELVPR